MTDAFFPFPPISLFDAAGLTGVALYVIAYSGVQVGQINGNSLLYTCLNGLAASGILISLLGSFNLASAMVNMMFLGFSLVGAGRILMATIAERRRRSHDERRAALAAPIEAATG
ncbi:MAG: hypothetical protein AAFR79_15865 [Pseudomonadota bacterium]